MNVSAKLSNASISAQKVRLVANQIRNKPVDKAIEILTFSQKKSCRVS